MYQKIVQLSVGVFFLLQGVTYSQSLPHAKRLFTLGDSLRQAGWYEQSTFHLEKAAKLYQKQPHWEEYVRCLAVISENYADSRMLDSAKRYAKKAITYGKQKSLISSTKSRAYLALSSAFIYQRQYDSARMYYNLATVLPTSNQTLLAAQSYNVLGRILTGVYQLDSARHCYSEAIALLHDTIPAHLLTLSDLYLRLGAYYGSQYEYDSAVRYYQKSLTLLQQRPEGIHPLMAKVYSNWAIDLHNRSDLDRALAHFQKALKIQEHFFGSSEETALGCHNVGIAYLKKHAFAKAHDYFSRTVDMLKDSPNKWLLTNAYLSLGANANNNNNFSLGKKNLQKALDTWHTSAEQDSTTLYKIFNNMASGYEKEQKIDSALIYFQKALATAQQMKQPQLVNVAIYHHNLGNAYLKHGQLDSALVHAQQALSIQQNSFDSKNATTASSWKLLGEIYAKQCRKHRALQSLQQALMANTPNFEDTVVAANPPATANYLDVHELLETLYYKANTLVGQSTSADLKLAMSSLQLGDTVIEQLQRTYQNHDDRVTLRQTAQEIYQAAVAVNVALFRQEHDSAYLHQAFYFSEKSKASVLTHALAELSAQHQAGIPDSVLTLERTLSVDRAYFTSQIQTEQRRSAIDSAALSNYQDRLFTINRRYDSLIRTLEIQHPQYYRLKYHNPIIAVPQLQQQLSENTTLVSSFLGDSLFYQFVVTPDTLGVVVQPFDSTLTQNIALLRSTLTPEAITELSQDTYHAYTRSAALLYQVLLDSVLSFNRYRSGEPRQLIVVADDVLGYVPYDVLLTQPVGADELPDYRHLPYLLHDYDVSYGYSATWLFQPPDRSKAPASQELIAFATTPQPNSSSSTSAPLVWNRDEVDQISHHVSARRYTGPLAQEHRFKAEAGQYQIIHLAAHSYTDSEDPLASRLVFSAGEDTAHREDNILYAHELYDMQLSADLAVLSACETGNGALAEGEGILSLARAFAYAGCASVVMSHWAADDESTATLMDCFYQHLAKGETIDQSLSQAKRTFLAESPAAFTHPYYWGNFMLVGNTDPVIHSYAGKYAIYLWVLIGLMLVAATVAVTTKYVRKHKKVIHYR